MTTEEKYDRLLERLRQKDQQFELKRELGFLLTKHVDDLTPKEKKRYNELIELLKINP